MSDQPIFHAVPLEPVEPVAESPTLAPPSSDHVVAAIRIDASTTDPATPRRSMRVAELAAMTDRWGVRGALRNGDRAILRHAASVPPPEMTPLALAALEQRAEAFSSHITATKLRRLIGEADEWDATALAARSFAQAVDDEATRARASVGRAVIDVYKDVSTSVRRRIDEGQLEEIAPRMVEIMRAAQGRRRAAAHREAAAAERAVKLAKRREQLRQQEMAALARAEKMRKEREGILEKGGGEGGK